MRKMFCLAAITIVFWGMVVSCSPSNGENDNGSITENQTGGKLLKYFGFKEKDNPLLLSDIDGSISGSIITIELKNKVDLSALNASFEVNEGSTVKIDGNIQLTGATPNNYYTDKKIVVIGSDLTEEVYTLNVKYDKTLYAMPEGLMINEAKNIDSFIYGSYTPVYSNGEYKFSMTNEALLSKIKLSFTLLSGFTANDKIGNPIVSEVTECDISSPFEMRVTTPTGEVVIFTIVSDITGFTDINNFKEYLDTITKEGITGLKTIQPVLPSGYTFTITDKENISIKSGFTPVNPVPGKTAKLTYQLERTADSAKLVGSVEVEIPESAATPITPATGNGIIIYGFAPAGPSGINDECVVIYNDSQKEIDICGYRIKYSTATGVTVSTKYIFGDKQPPLAAGKYLLVAGKSFVTTGWGGNTTPDIRDDSDFGFSGSSGHIIIADKDNKEIDRVGYGDALKPETKAVAYDTVAGLIYRKEPVADTNDNFTDFVSPIAAGGTLRNSQN